MRIFRFVVAASALCITAQAFAANPQAGPMTGHVGPMMHDHGPAMHGMAPGGHAPSFDEAFNADDANHDGGLSLEEMIAGQHRRMEMMEQRVDAAIKGNFAKMDKNHDGKVTREELMQYRAEMPRPH